MVFVQILNFIKKEAILHKNLAVNNKNVFSPMLLASGFFYYPNYDFKHNR